MLIDDSGGKFGLLIDDSGGKFGRYGEGEASWPNYQMGSTEDVRLNGFGEIQNVKLGGVEDVHINGARYAYGYVPAGYGNFFNNQLGGPFDFITQAVNSVVGAAAGVVDSVTGSTVGDDAAKVIDSVDGGSTSSNKAAPPAAKASAPPAAPAAGGSFLSKYKYEIGGAVIVGVGLIAFLAMKKK